MPLDLGLPPKLILPSRGIIARPAIIRQVDPWKVSVNEAMIRGRIPRSVRREIIAAVESALRKETSKNLKSVIDDIAVWSGEATKLAFIPGILAAKAFVGVGQATAFPAIRDAVGSQNSTSATSHVVTYPTYSAGDLVVIIIAAQVNSSGVWTTELDSFTLFDVDANGAGDGQCAIYARIMDGGEGSDNTISISATSRAAWNIYSFSGIYPSATLADILASNLSADAGASTSANPSTLTPSWGSAKVIWLAGVACNHNNVPSAWDGDYSSAITGNVTTTNGPTVTSYRYQQEASSENPDAFTISSSRFVTLTVGVRGGFA